MKHPLVPRIYVADVSLLWTLMWIASWSPYLEPARRGVGLVSSFLSRRKKGGREDLHQVRRDEGAR